MFSTAAASALALKGISSVLAQSVKSSRYPLEPRSGAVDQTRRRACRAPNRPLTPRAALSQMGKTNSILFRTEFLMADTALNFHAKLRSLAICFAAAPRNKEHSHTRNNEIYSIECEMLNYSALREKVCELIRQKRNIQKLIKNFETLISPSVKFRGRASASSLRRICASECMCVCPRCLRPRSIRASCPKRLSARRRRLRAQKH